MKTFNPKDDTSVFDIEEFLKRDSYYDNDIVEATDLLGMAWQEIKALRSRLEIDRYYVYDKVSKEFQMELSKDNNMLCSGDKIDCLQIEIDSLCESVIEGKGKKFVEMNFPKYK